MKAILTRPLKNSLDLKKQLTNVECIICPVIEIKYKKFPIAITAKDILIFSSANAVTAFASNSKKRSNLAILIGKTSYLEAKKLGFKRTVLANKGNDVSAENLYKFLLENYSAKYNFKYICGEDLSFDLEKNLKKSGYKIEKIVSYKAEKQKFLNESLKSELLNDNIKSVLFYSTRTANIFCEEVIDKLGVATLKKLVAFCYSKKIAETLQKNNFADIKIIRDNISLTREILNYGSSKRKKTS